MDNLFMPFSRPGEGLRGAWRRQFLLVLRFRFEML